MSERAEKLLMLKGVAPSVDEEEGNDDVDRSERILEQYQQKKLDAATLEVEILELEKEALIMIIKRLKSGQL